MFFHRIFALKSRKLETFIELWVISSCAVGRTESVRSSRRMRYFTLKLQGEEKLVKLQNPVSTEVELRNPHRRDCVWLQPFSCSSPLAGCEHVDFCLRRFVWSSCKDKSNLSSPNQKYAGTIFKSSPLKPEPSSSLFSLKRDVIQTDGLFDVTHQPPNQVYFAPQAGLFRLETCTCGCPHLIWDDLSTS